MMKFQMRPWRLLLLFIILLGFGLRLYQLDNFSFWQDEGLTPLRASYSVAEILSNRVTIQEGVTQDTHPPFYFLIIHYSQSALGRSDFSYRYPSVLAGVLLLPLLGQFGRRLHGPRMGALAAVLAAVNPLQVWYAQEARMYTLLALLAAAASYVLWRALSQPALSLGAVGGRLALYLLLAALAVYTHYTAIFLVAAQGIFWAWLLWRQGQQRLILATGVLGVLALVPLLPFLIPRLFTGAETRYFYVPPHIMLQDVVHGFGMGLTVDFSQPLIKLLDLGVLLVLLAGLLGRRGEQGGGRPVRLFLLTMLLAAVVGLALGSLIKPMYLGARHIIVGSPAFFLLAGRGLMQTPTGPRRRVAQMAGLAALLAGPAVSLNNLYHNHIYVKDGLRELVRHIERSAGGKDIVVYNNAILLATHWHYQERPELRVTAIPIYPHLAGANSEEQVAALAASYGRIWYVVDPPADGRDESGVVRAWLVAHSSLHDRADFNSQSMVVSVETYVTAALEAKLLPADGRTLDIGWDELPALRGVRFDFAEPAALPTLWLELFWQGGQPPASDWQLRFRLVGPDGGIWLDNSQPLQQAQAAPWTASGFVRLEYALPLVPGTPPGSYELEVQPWRAASGEAAGEPQVLASLTLAATSEWPVAPRWSFAGVAPVYFEGGLELVGLSPMGATVRPGNPVPITLYWRRNGEATLPADAQYELEVVAPNGRVLRRYASQPGPKWLPFDQWPLGAILSEPSGLYFPPEIAPGLYRLRWRVVANDSAIPGRPAWRPWPSQSVVFGKVAVLPWPLEREAPRTAQAVGARLGHVIELVSYELDRESLRPGGLLTLALYWKALAVPEASYIAFVHLVDDKGEIVKQSDRVPMAGLRPTPGWRAGEVIWDVYSLPIPAGVEPGQYQLVIGLYHAETGERLPITWRGEQQPDHRLLLETIYMPAPETVP